MKKYTGVFSLVLFLSWSIQASHATVITFDDLADFTATTGATATAPLPNVGLVPGGPAASYTVGDLTFSLASPALQLYLGTGSGFKWTNRIGGNAIAISDQENLNVDLAAPVYSFGFEIVEVENDPYLNAPTFYDSIFEVSLLLAGTLLEQATFNAPNDTAAFFGIWSDQAFDRVEIREIYGGIDNEFFGQFYTGTAPLAMVVPAPSPLWLLGLAGAWVWWRQKYPRGV